jgi:hypothetical protein
MWNSLELKPRLFKGANLQSFEDPLMPSYSREKKCVKPYRDIEFKYEGRLFQIQIWGHPEFALLLITPLQPLALPLDSFLLLLSKGLSESLFKEFCLDPFHLIFVSTNAGHKVENSYFQVQQQLHRGECTSHCKHNISIDMMNHFMREGEWLGESSSFLL